MASLIDKTEIERLLAQHGQGHLLAHWDRIDDAGRRQLADQIAKVDFPLIDSLYRGAAGQPDWDALSRRAEPPPAVRLTDRAKGGANALGIDPKAAHQCGVEALQSGKVGVLLVAGGQGSRLGFEKPKSIYPIGPVSNKTLLEIHAEKVRAAARRYEAGIPLYLMNSSATLDDTVAYLEQNANVGLDADDLFVFCQGSMPAVDAQTGRLLMSSRDSLFLSPDGHGGTVAALAASGAFDHMRSHGIEALFYLQVDNPLAPICDPELIGCHLLANSQLTSLAIAKQQPTDKLGNFVAIDGRVQVIEYSDFPADVAERRDEQGELVFWAGSVAIHVFDVAFLQESVAIKDALPFHIAEKKVPYVDESGEHVEPTTNNALKFERFIFDLLPRAKNPIVVEYPEEDVFAPLKNAPGAEKDTPEYVQRFMLDQHKSWLKAAGVTLDANARVELSPLFALDDAGVKQRVAELGDRLPALSGDVYLSDEA